jgi:hypothetical protein
VLVAAQIIGGVLIVLAVAWIGVRSWQRRVAASRSRKWNRLRRALTDEERQVIELRYGLYDGQPRTLEEVEQAFGLTRERIREIENQTLLKLQALEGKPAPVADASSADYPDEPDPEGGLGVREPRRPRPSGLSGSEALPLPDPALDS